LILDILIYLKISVNININKSIHARMRHETQTNA